MTFKRLKNRLYVSWTNSTGMDCILIGPETPCFCQHRYYIYTSIIFLVLLRFYNLRFKNHQTDFKELPKNRPIPLPCKEAGCPCSSFQYVPKNGSQAIRCGIN